MSPSITAQLDTGQMANFFLPERAEQQLFAAVVLEKTRLQHESDKLSRIYHLGEEPTPSLPYDDRLTVRLGYGVKTIYTYLKKGEKKGGLRSYRMGRDYRVTEQAVLDFTGESAAKKARQPKQ